MSFVTYKYKNATCPEWGEEVQIRGKYIYNNNGNGATFQHATCPIRENLHLPNSKRNHNYDLFAFCKNDNCQLLHDFPEFIED